MRKETVDVEFLVTSRNGSRKVLHVYLELEYTGIFLKIYRYIWNITGIFVTVLVGLFLLSLIIVI